MEFLETDDVRENEERWFMQPYFINSEIRSRWLFSAGVGVFIFFFLTVFKPFGIADLNYAVLRFTLGFGVLSFMMVAIFHVGYRSWWLNRYNEREWMAYHEILLMLVMIVCIGIANYVYSEEPWVRGWSFVTLLFHQLTTMVVAIFPVIFGVFISQKNLQRKYSEASAAINAARSVHQEVVIDTGVLELKGSGDADILSLNVNDLSHIQAADNYVLVFREIENGYMEKVMLRATMTNIAVQLSEYPFILRSHKSYFVNLQKVVHVSGNAQGYKLHLRHADDLIPVSRSLNKMVKEELLAKV